jgi:hypothetical protein
MWYERLAVAFPNALSDFARTVALLIMGMRQPPRRVLACEREATGGRVPDGG